MMGHDEKIIIIIIHKPLQLDTRQSYYNPEVDSFPITTPLTPQKFYNINYNFKVSHTFDKFIPVITLYQL